MLIQNTAQPQACTTAPPPDCPLPIKYHRRYWMEKNGITQVELAARFGLTSGMSVSRMMTKGVALQEYIDILRDEYGMPEHLLPEPSRGKTGPLSKEEWEQRKGQSAAST